MSLSLFSRSPLSRFFGVALSLAPLTGNNAWALGAPSPEPTPSTAPTSAPSIDPAPSPSHSAVTGNVLSDISAIATKSSCAAYNWKDRGRAPAAYIAGMAVTFAKSLCRYRAGQSTAQLMAQKATGNSKKDVLTWYESRFDTLKLEIDRAGGDTLRSLYTLGIGLGMRESSGKYCEGYDVAVESQTATTAEAGLFQTSQNSISASTELRKLYNEYKSNTSKCHLSTFSKNVSCRARSIVGTGAGADFQRLAKSCPAFATEYAMTTLRLIRSHYGPINQKNAEIIGSCAQMLDQVQNYVESRSDSVCASL